MADLIRHKRSDTASAIPSAGQLELGELAINVADGRLYFKKASGAVIAVANLADTWALRPIGEKFPLDTHMPGVEIPPTDNPNYRYIKLTASDSYNDGVLTGESVTGSGVLLQATAVIDDSASPLTGETVRLINTESRVIRAGVNSGVVEQDAAQGHRHGFRAGTGNIAGMGIETPAMGASVVNYPSAPGQVREMISDGTNGDPRVADETRVKAIRATYFMRVR